jgi:hypothetical protein
MKTLRNPRDKESLLQRLLAVRRDSPRRWGKMSAHQMVCHLADTLRCPLGEKTITPQPGWYPRALLRLFALRVPLPWPHGFKTRPEFDQQAGGTPPTEFAADVSELRNLLERFTRQPRDFELRPHPVFGSMSEADWMRWGYLHIDHHLRQFGA